MASPQSLQNAIANDPTYAYRQAIYNFVNTTPVNNAYCISKGYSSFRLVPGGPFLDSPKKPACVDSSGKAIPFDAGASSDYDTYITKAYNASLASTHATNSVPPPNQMPTAPAHSVTTDTGKNVPVTLLAPSTTMGDPTSPSLENAIGSIAGIFTGTLHDFYAMPLNVWASAIVSWYRGNGIWGGFLDGLIVAGFTSFAATGGSLYVEAKILEQTKLQSNGGPLLHYGVKGAIFAMLQSGYSGYLVTRESYSTYSKEFSINFAQSAIIDLGLYYLIKI